MLIAATLAANLAANLAYAPPPPPPSSSAPRAERAPRLRRRLANGAIALGEARPDTTRFRIEAFLAQPEPEGPADEGRRHLIEHLVAARDPALDLALGQVGGSFGAATSRDGMRFWVQAPAVRSDLAVRTLDALLRPIAPLPEAIARQARLIRRERLLLGPPERASIAGWLMTYGSEGLSPLGPGEGLGESSPDDLARRWARLLTGRRLAVGAAGPADVDALAERAARIASRFPPGEPVPWAPRRAVTSGGSVEGAAVLAVPSVAEPEALAAVGAALALAGDQEGGAVVYTPSDRAAAITLTGAESRMTPTAGALRRAAPILRRWLAALANDPDDSLGLRLALLRQNPILTPELLLDRATAVSASAWARAFAAWSRAASGREGE